MQIVVIRRRGAKKCFMNALRMSNFFWAKPMNCVEEHLVRLRAGTSVFLFLLVGSLAGATNDVAENTAGAEGSALERGLIYLQREVPAWNAENGCYSCHNNGDGARALYAASRKGFAISERALADTTDWLSRPWAWDKNKGDPEFSDKKLANIQFGAALVSSMKAGSLEDRSALVAAARRIAAEQLPDGNWRMEAVGTLGSPVTYGDLLGTRMALLTLRRTGMEEFAERIQKGEMWMAAQRPKNALSLAALVLARTDSEVEIPKEVEREWMEKLEQWRTSDGGWGPWPVSPAEVFDTAMALLALDRITRNDRMEDLVESGRAYLERTQEADGGWPATTRPPGERSYAQRVSTSAWAVLALLETETE